MKIILIVIDGLGDAPIKELGRKTPLRAARTPHLDWLAMNGTFGLVLPFTDKGKIPTSEDSHLAIFGYNPVVYNPGRGVFEVAGIGMEIKPNDVCLRGNFATVNRNGLIIDRRAGRIQKTEALIRKISGIKVEGVKFLIGKSISHRIGIIMRGKGLSAKIADGDPKKTGVKPLKILPKDDSREAAFTAKILNRFLEISSSKLKENPQNKRIKEPANYILVRGAGAFRKIPTFSEKYRLKAGCIAGGTLYKGIGKVLEMDLIKVKGANALPTTNLKGKIEAIRKALKKHDFIFCHIKASDSLAEDGNFLGKKAFIEKIDSSLKPLLSLKNILIVVTADHSTCSKLKRHCNLPCPVLVYPFSGKGKKKTVKFSERICRNGKLGTFPQLGLMKKILKLADVKT